MSHLLALGGVACTTKTTILKNLQKYDDNIVVHLDDYKELNDKFDFDCRVGSLLFAAYRSKNDIVHLKDYKNVHIFDRQPMEALIYVAINQNMSDEDAIKMYETCVAMGLCDNWLSLLLKPIEHSFDRLVKMMKKRNNNLDVCTREYVTNQNHQFYLWQNATHWPNRVINCRENIDAQQESIVNTLLGMIYEWCDHHNGFIEYKYKLPIIKNKIAIFNLENTLICTKSRAVQQQNETDWQLKYTTIHDTFVNLLDNDYSIFIMTNQMNTKNLSQLKQKIKLICKTIQLPLTVYISTQFNNYRKPRTGMFEHLMVKQPFVDFTNSFYCGDNLNGLTNADSLFAKNCNLKFYYDFNFF
ncbi:nicotinamide riboside kinase 1 [Ectropis obliqua nucleopolyhedrovirus]|uniref:Nicotinamide riboside kinase 1 n=1 Tax=Ectropis obliqua nucleopolyhedrovirus TaxID=59376 RepID=A0EZ17_9ABAC|nr:nicotinamide riboside kinase 1 [Ectropis obliqua nucleopolyhedrovirus]ABI35797.1 nicotinamide riboside kinase 1 [Ectropis obliqua nucleopolyhedrovirus]AGS47957.1 putative 33.9 kDa protein [Ectropis obliqua nucleopolyhedrovirus]QWV59619.1 nicotinamide riboside kinase 1 [Ectropis obliqua nucleopolyhedrovirus]UYO72910.1 nicotinamide riboside kinase 1 [Ectropis obliqua nucleopolyhedrovirus]